MARQQENQMVGEVIGLTLLGLGTLLFLALISYVPRDVPGWVPIIANSAAATHINHNFIGPAGAIIAGLFYFLVGAGSYVVPAVLLGYGGAKLLAPCLQINRRTPWVIGAVISFACIMDLQHYFLKDWRYTMRIPGVGGWLGHWIGHLFYNALGPLGSGILLVLIYSTCLVMMTGIHPISLVRKLVALPGIWAENRRKGQLARADERERLAIQGRKLAKEAGKIERQLRKKNALPAPDAALDAQDEVAPTAEELWAVSRPAPQIIDTALAKPASKDNKPKPQPVSYENYTLPDLDLLDAMDEEGRQAADPEELKEIQATIIETLGQFGIAVAPGDITRGPTITRYEVYPAKGVRVDKITSLERDIARATRAERINILAPIPGKDTVGIEIANSRKMKVSLRELLESDEWHNTKARIPLALGKDVYGNTIIADLAQMPHLLVAGTTGSGKSVCINSIIASMLYRFTPEDLRFVMIDPKVVEMQVYNNLPHLIIPVVTDPKKVLLALRHVVLEMENRYKIFAKTGVRNITSFNARPKPKSQKELDAEAEAKAATAPEAAGEEAAPENGSVEEYIENVSQVRVPREDDVVIPEKMHYIVVIVDELADLMQTAPADVESAIARITQMARAAGIHMIVATQTPRADVITGVIKANIPCRIAFQVASKLDSRIIIENPGAERLLGQGDMLYMPPGTSRLIRSQGVLVTDDEIRRIIDHTRQFAEPQYDSDMQDRLSDSNPVDDITEEEEELVQKCIEIMRQEKKASTSLFQRRLRLGYSRAARVVDILEARRYIAPGEGAKPREILVDLDALV
ncbi:MAG TPA: DNA translocase FtsK [Chthoniobacteraceae bacterium]|jgi:S-DNA-T family DNA segregation ATPase FtsK/SpoIIIE|nr:DNA translocase FtsK [Chthoniobacteraceae bacterium]